MSNNSESAMEKKPPAGKKQDTKEVSENLKFWNEVCDPPKEMLKPITLGKRKYTSICAYWQIMKATEQFGRLGIDWHYEAETVVLTDLELIMEVRLWVPDAKFPIIQYGSVATFGEQTHAQNESHKKTITNGLTKCLSYIGIGAGVHLGNFDDNPYPEEETPEEKINRIEGLKKKDWVECPMCKDPMLYKEWKKGDKEWKKYECRNNCKDQNKPQYKYSIFAEDATVIPGTESSESKNPKQNNDDSKKNAAHLKELRGKIKTAYDDLIELGLDQDYLAGEIKSWNLDKNVLADAASLLKKFKELYNNNDLPF